MKKAVKLVWMLLFALPVLSLTSCENDDDKDLVYNNSGIGVDFKQYQDLLNKDRDDVMKKMNIEVADADEFGIFYENVQTSIPELDVYYTFFYENEYGATETYEKSVWVDIMLDKFSNDELYNFLTDKYGKGSMNEDDIMVYTKGNLYVFYDYVDTNEIWISYVNKSEKDKADKDHTRASENNFFETLKALHRAK